MTKSSLFAMTVSNNPTKLALKPAPKCSCLGSLFRAPVWGLCSGLLFRIWSLIFTNDGFMPVKSGQRGSLDGAPLTDTGSFVFPALSVFYEALPGLCNGQRKASLHQRSRTGIYRPRLAAKSSSVYSAIAGSGRYSGIICFTVLNSPFSTWIIDTDLSGILLPSL